MSMQISIHGIISLEAEFGGGVIPSGPHNRNSWVDVKITTNSRIVERHVVTYFFNDEYVAKQFAAAINSIQPRYEAGEAGKVESA